ncbi:hypothetical protein HYX10_03200 [Candidatus Woesearchaeota archaeon]|nr:hypothetical protein [Candidatus Woesearchaeota archaeon]
MAEGKEKTSLLNEWKFKKEEVAELVSGVTEKTGFPQPLHFYRLVVEAINLPIEEAYFWTIDELKYGWSYNKLHKITDINAASEGSAFFGVSEQRLGAQQDKAAQFLRGISEMLKALFQIVRELRIIDERLGYYEHTFNRSRERKDEEASGSEITLKGIWVDQVEGGVKNAASVYGLAQTVGFTVLPDLFFRVRANDIGLHKEAEKNFDAATNKVVDTVDAAVDSLKGFNEKVKEVLNRKLTQYYMWKLRTYRELRTRRKFTIKYLRQHYDTIKLYTGWVKPYLRNILRLGMAEKLVRSDVADLITAFEGALVEIEVLAIKETGRKYKPCILVHMYYRTRPALSYVQEGYQRGPMHTGKFDMKLRGYVWSDDQISNYINMKEAEDMHLLGTVSESIKESMDAMGSELKEYLKEGGEQFEEDKKEEEKKKSQAAEAVKGAAEPFIGVFSGVKEIVAPFTHGIRLRKKGGAKGDDVKDELNIESARADLKRSIYQTYKNYKKMHGMMTW